MDQVTETCPWCNKRVLVDRRPGRIYACPYCKKNFTAEAGASPEPAGVPGAPSEGTTVRSSDFVETPYVKDLVGRALAYLQDGLHVHLSGPAGSGKTTIAIHVAQLIGRPVVLIHGDDQMGTADLVGKESGFKRSYTRDEYVRNVFKMQEEAKPLWVGKALTEACQKGLTVVYDEFTRSRPEANNVLLSVMEERVLPLRGATIPVHPDFRIIFTSNPADYAGVHGVQDALLDRMVTIIVSGFDQETEVAITHARSGLPEVEVARVVALVRAFRGEGLNTSSASVRPAILISRILKVRGGHAWAEDHVFIQTCRDVLLSQARRAGAAAKDQPHEETLARLIREICSEPLPSERSRIEEAIQEMKPAGILAELSEDREFQELLLRKLREKGLAG